MPDRVTLADRDARATLMRQHMMAVAEWIPTDRRGDAAFARYLGLVHRVRNHLVGNRVLISRRAPRSRLVAPGTAFDRTAAVVVGYHGHPARVAAAYLRGFGAKPADVIRSMDRIASVADESLESVERDHQKGSCGPAEPRGATESAPGVHGVPNDGSGPSGRVLAAR